LDLILYNIGMNDFIKQDIFFFITTIAVAIFTLVLSVGIFYVIKILRDIKYITKKARDGADIIGEDLSQLRENVKNKGSNIAFLVNFFKNIKNKKKGR